MRVLLILPLLVFCLISQAQENPNPLPKHLSQEEIKILKENGYQAPGTVMRGIISPPNSPVRTIGEWEELEAIVVTWDAYFGTLREIVRYAKDELEVINVCQDSNSLKSYLSASGIDMENLTFIEAPFNTVWVRDYGPNPVYTNDVDSLVLIDWIYNRPRPADDVIPGIIGEYLGVPVYCTTQAPYDMVHTGGNFMSDGLGAGFSSRLILEENDASNQFGISNHSEEDIENIINLFMGIDIYPKMEALPYDGINHIDMHMKMLDEQTILIGEFPLGVSDGPQIEENIQYLLDNFKTYWGTDFKIERILQPPCGNGSYPPNCQSGAEYRTYTNALIVNKTILVPIYNTALDQIALQRWQELKPGYKIVGIDCRQIINAGGAIHCITKEIGSKNPLWISHRELDDVIEEDNIADYQIEALIRHRDGIESATVYWSLNTDDGYNAIEMELESAESNLWRASIPQQIAGGRLFYYIEAFANSGKSINRPLAAPEAYFDFEIEALNTSTSDQNLSLEMDSKMYPNPVVDHTVLELHAIIAGDISIDLTSSTGQKINRVFVGKIQEGKNYIYLEFNNLQEANYFLNIQHSNYQNNHLIQFSKVN